MEMEQQEEEKMEIKEEKRKSLIESEKKTRKLKSG